MDKEQRNKFFDGAIKIVPKNKWKSFVFTCYGYQFMEDKEFLELKKRIIKEVWG